MNPSRAPVRSAPLVLAAIAIAAALAACGGGGSDAGTSTFNGGTTTGPVVGPGVGGTGAVAIGPISGFGSVIVNGVRFDDSAPGVRILDGDDNPSTSDRLALGMLVQVAGSTPQDSATGPVSTATEIRYGSELTGVVSAVDAAAGSLRVFGVPVRVKPTTVFDDVRSLAAIPAGAVVEVYGLRDATDAIVATRIELKAASLGLYAAQAGRTLRLTGRVTAVGTDRFSIAAGDDTVVVRPSSGVVAGVVVGARVTVRLQPTVSAGVWTAERVSVAGTGLSGSFAQAEVEGIVERLSGSDLTVAGLPVRVSSSTVYRNGTAADLKVGSRIEAEGPVTGGVIVATKVEIKVLDDDDSSNDDRSSSDDTPFRLSGAIGSSDTAARTFTLRGSVVRWDAATRFDDGAATSIAAGVAVEVRAVRDPSDASRLLATRIRFDR